MSGNGLILYCQPCMEAKEADYGFKLAGRDVIGPYKPYGPAAATKNFTNWLRKHSKCGGQNHPDHFGLAHLAERDYDQPRIVSGPLITRALKAVN